MILLIDGNNMAFRSFSVMKLLQNSRGEGTGAVFGFLMSLHQIVRRWHPEDATVFWDHGKSEWRCREYPEYKAHRAGLPDDEYESYLGQLKRLADVLDSLGVRQVGGKGAEADDLIAQHVIWNEENTTDDMMIVSTDKDFYQLLTARTSMLVNPAKIGRAGTITYDEFVKEYGILPKQWPDVRALMGDKSDNIPGVPGIGEVKALRLIEKYGSIENLIGWVETKREGEPDAFRVWEKRNEVKLYKRLLKLTGLQSGGEVRRGRMNRAAFTSHCAELGFESILMQRQAWYRNFRFGAGKRAPKEEAV